MNNPPSLLCVEDNDDARELLEIMLGHEGYDVTSCATSKEALELARRSSFSAIILDHRLDNISGFEVCRRIRTDDLDTPIVFYSGSAFPEDREEGLAAGANAYLVKPTDFQKITETLERLISAP